MTEPELMEQLKDNLDSMFEEVAKTEQNRHICIFG
jgi:hypothetical protein